MMSWSSTRWEWTPTRCSLSTNVTTDTVIAICHHGRIGTISNRMGLFGVGGKSHNNQLMMVTHEGQSMIGKNKSGGEKRGMEDHI
jgi:hypothetical protein